MAEFVASMMGNNLPMDTSPAKLNQSAPAPGQADLSNSPDGASFPQLFASFDPDSVPVDDNLLANALNPFAPLPMVTGTQPTMDMGMMMSGVMGQGGNVLPQNMPGLHFIGYVAQGDQDGAAAISFSGDNKNIVATNPQLAAGITPAIQQSQMKLQEGLQQQAINQQLDLQNVNIMGQAQLEEGRQLELLAEMAKQTDSAIENLSSKPTTSSAFSQALSSSMTIQDSSNPLVASSRALQPMTANLQQPHWNEQIGERLNLMIARDMQKAEIRLNPPELGMLEVKVQVQGDQANIQFSTPHGQVKDALDAAIPRLREMLEENGLTLGDVNVSHQSLANDQSQSGEDAEAQSFSRSKTHDDDLRVQDGDIKQNTIISGEIGLLDVFA